MDKQFRREKWKLGEQTLKLWLCPYPKPRSPANGAETAGAFLYEPPDRKFVFRPYRGYLIGWEGRSLGRFRFTTRIYPPNPRQTIPDNPGMYSVKGLRRT